MKKTILITMLFVMLFAAGTSALQISTGTIGNSDQDRVDNVSTTITVTNDGSTTLSNIVMSFAGDSKYNVRFDPATFSLAPAAVQTVTVTGDIPIDFDAVVKHSSDTDFLKETPFKVGTVKAAVGTTEAIVDLNMQAVNQLTIKKVNAVCGDKSERLDDNEAFEELSPDMACSITIEFENLFNDNDRDDLRIGDVELDPVYVEVESMDSELDLDEDDDTSLDADDEEDMTFDFEIEEDTEEGKYTTEIRVYGVDENGAYHGEMWEVKFEVERLKHDIQIKSAVLSPVQFDNCQDRTINLDARLLNLGKRDEDAVAARATIDDLNLEETRSNIELDEDDDERVSFSFNIPKGTESRVYTVELNTFFDTTGLSNTKRFDFVVNKCEVEDTTVVDTTDTTTTVTTTDVPVTTGATTTARVRSSDASSFKDSPAYIWLLAGISVLLAVIVIVLLIVLFRRPLDEE